MVTGYKMLTMHLKPHRFDQGEIVQALTAVLGSGGDTGLLPTTWYGTADSWDEALAAPVLELAGGSVSSSIRSVWADRSELSEVGTRSLSLWSPTVGSTVDDQKNYRLTCQFYVGDDSKDTLTLGSVVRIDFPIPEPHPESVANLLVGAFPTTDVSQVVGVEDDPGFMDRVLQNPGGSAEVRTRIFYP